MKSSNNNKFYMQPIPCKNKEVYNELNTLIFEYLEVNGLEKALRTFSHECHLKNLPCPQPTPESENEVKAAFTHYDGQQLLKSFDEGNLQPFLELWKQFQTHIQVTSEDMKKLEVYLRVHFAIWPKAKGEPEEKQLQSMQVLKTFFEENSESLSSDPTILPLFALPYVSDPRPHPIFKDLFQESWTAKLRAQLETTVNKYFELLQENITTHCKLASVLIRSKSRLLQGQGSSMPTDFEREPKAISLSNSNRSLSIAGSNHSTKKSSKTSLPEESRGDSYKNGAEDAASAKYHEERFYQLLSIHRKQRKVLKGVRENYGKLLKVCSILLESLEHSEEVAVDNVIQQCFLVYPHIFTNPSSSPPSSPITKSKPDLDHFKRLCTTSSTTLVTSDVSDIGLLFLGIPNIGIDTINYEKIKADLASERLPPTDKLCLLQALRWLVTKSSPSSRSQVVLYFVQNDLLGLEKSPETCRKIFAPFLSPTPTYQKESLSRLINSIASTWTGRTYLTSSNFIIDTLTNTLTTFKTQDESFICHMVIATLQKLSLRKAMRLTMIEKNVIPWLVRYIKTELERDLVREEVDQVLMEEADTLHNNNNDVSYGDTIFNSYLMEYAWALLMNLCLHPESIKSALTVDFEFLHIIVTMLTSKFSCTASAAEFIPYVLSTLFSLLRNPDLFDKAKSMKLDKKLRAVMDQQPQEIATHMKHLLNQLYEKRDVDRLMALGETEYNDSDNPDPDELETELELQESWMTAKNEGDLFIGDDLLIKKYILHKDPSRVESPDRNGNGETNNDIDEPNSVDFPTSLETALAALISRPKTPRKTPPVKVQKEKERIKSPSPPPSPQPYNPTSKEKVLVGESTPTLTPPFHDHLRKLPLLVHPNEEDHLENQSELLARPEEDREERELSPPSLVCLPAVPKTLFLKAQMEETPTPTTPPPIQDHQPTPQTTPNQHLVPTTIKIVKNIVTREDLERAKANNRESPVIKFSCNENNFLSQSAHPPSDQPQFEKNIVISYLDYEEMDENNNPENDFIIKGESSM